MRFHFLLLLFLFGCATLEGPNKNNILQGSNQTNLSTEGASSKPVEESKSDLISIPQECAQLKLKEREDCLMSKAVEKGANVCTFIGRESARRSCLLKVFEKSKTDICQNIISSTNRFECYLHIAKASGDTSLCSKLEFSPTTCLAVARNDDEICKQAASHEKGLCYNELARHNLDYRYCENAEFKENCIAFVAGLKNDIEACKKLKDDDDLCLLNIALEQFDKEICGLLNDQEKRDGCYYQYYEKTNDKDACLKIANPLVDKFCK